MANFWVDLDDAEELFAACKAVALRFQGDTVLFRFSAIELSSVALHFVEDGVAPQMVRYGEPLRLDSPTMLVAAHMTVGWEGSNPLPHAHGYISTNDGRVLGGHLAPGLCMVARRAGRLQAHLTVVKGCGLIQQADSETGFRLLSPVQRRTH